MNALLMYVFMRCQAEQVVRDATAEFDRHFDHGLRMLLAGILGRGERG